MVQLNGKNSNKPDDVGRSLGADGDRLTTKESRGSETARSWEKTTIKMGRLREEG